MLHLAGIALQDIFDTLSEPAVEPDAEPLPLYDRAMKMLDDHFKFTPNTTFERHMFRQMAQREGETTAQFAIVCANKRSFAISTMNRKTSETSLWRG